MRAILFGVVMVCVATVAEAQTCMGSVPISRTARGVADFSLGLQDDIYTISGSVGGGGDKAFGTVGGSWSEIDVQPKVNAWTIDGVFGSQIAADTRRRIMLCPFGMIGIGRLANLPVDDLETPTLVGTQAGLSVGITAVSGAVASLVPFVGVAFVSTESYGAEDFFGKVSERNGEFSAGVGVVLNGGQSAIRAMITKPFAADDVGSVAFRLTYAIGFGRR